MINAKQYNSYYGAFYIIYWDCNKGYWVDHVRPNGRKSYDTYGRARNEARKLTKDYPNVKIMAYNATTDATDSLDY